MLFNNIIYYYLFVCNFHVISYEINISTFVDNDFIHIGSAKVVVSMLLINQRFNWDNNFFSFGLYVREY